MVDRLWVDEQKPVYVDNLEQIVKKIYVAVALCSYGVGANQGALKLDSCIMRYTQWSDDEREDFIYPSYVQESCPVRKMDFSGRPARSRRIRPA